MYDLLSVGWGLLDFMYDLLSVGWGLLRFMYDTLSVGWGLFDIWRFFGTKSYNGVLLGYFFLSFLFKCKIILGHFIISILLRDTGTPFKSGIGLVTRKLKSLKFCT